MSISLNAPERIKTGCKINLFLIVKDRRPDGYHELESFFIPLDEPCDFMEITCAGPRGTIEVHCPIPGIDERNNTLTKAYAKYAAKTGFAPDISINLEKGVPHGSGLGGASANAAAFLKYLRDKHAFYGNTALNDDELLELGATVGADVPFFLLNKPAFVRGIGEIITPMQAPWSGMKLVLVCPAETVSTAWAFKELDSLRERKNSAVPEKLEPDGLTSNNLQDTTPFARELLPGNDFEAVVFKGHSQLCSIRDRLVNMGADFARMSGTGASIFGLFHDVRKAEKAAGILKDDGLKVFEQTM